MSRNLKAAIDSVREQFFAARRRTDELGERLRQLEAEHDRLRFVCQCVVLNRNAGIFGMAEQERAGRGGLSLGLVADTRSALKACPTCHGTGVPVEEVACGFLCPFVVGEHGVTCSLPKGHDGLHVHERNGGRVQWQSSTFGTNGTLEVSK